MRRILSSAFVVGGILRKQLERAEAGLLPSDGGDHGNLGVHVGEGAASVYAEPEILCLVSPSRAPSALRVVLLGERLTTPAWDPRPRDPGRERGLDTHAYPVREHRTEKFARFRVSSSSLKSGHDLIQIDSYFQIP